MDYGPHARLSPGLYNYFFSDKYILITALNTRSPFASVTFTFMGQSPGLDMSATGISQTAFKSVFAIFRYETVIPLGIHLRFLGIEASSMVPAASSLTLHMAMAWTEFKWLVTDRLFFSKISLYPGRSSRNSGLILPKYGALKQMSFEKMVLPYGSLVQVW